MLKPLPIQVHLFARVLKPVVLLFLRSQHGFKAFCDLARQVFVSVAQEELERLTTRINPSRLSAITGLTRTEVLKVLKSPGVTTSGNSISLFQRIIGQWEQDKRFTNAQGEPRVLSAKGKDSEFALLVQSVQGHVSVGTVLFGLKSRGLVTETARGIKLERPVDIPRQDMEQVMTLLGQDFSSLSSVITTNILEGPGTTHHIRTEYDNIDLSKLPEIRQWIAEEGKAFHRRARSYLAQFDLDINSQPDAKGGGRVVLGSFGSTSTE